MKMVHRASRIALVTAVGATLIVIGVVMLVTPGPGLLAIAGGLAVLAREYSWARRLLDQVKARLPSRDRDRHERMAGSWSAPASGASDGPDGLEREAA